MNLIDHPAPTRPLPSNIRGGRELCLSVWYLSCIYATTTPIIYSQYLPCRSIEGKRRRRRRRQDERKRRKDVEVNADELKEVQDFLLQYSVDMTVDYIIPRLLLLFCFCCCCCSSGSLSFWYSTFFVIKSISISFYPQPPACLSLSSSPLNNHPQPIVRGLSSTQFPLANTHFTRRTTIFPFANHRRTI